MDWNVGSGGVITPLWKGPMFLAETPLPTFDRAGVGKPVEIIRPKPGDAWAG